SIGDPIGDCRNHSMVENKWVFSPKDNRKIFKGCRPDRMALLVDDLDPRKPIKATTGPTKNQAQPILDDYSSESWFCLPEEEKATAAPLVASSDKLLGVLLPAAGGAASGLAELLEILAIHVTEVAAAARGSTENSGRALGAHKASAQ